jgi:PKD repeat protein
LIEAQPVLTAMPISGLAPLTVTFSVRYQQGDGIDFGDDSFPYESNCPFSWCGAIITHIYTASGTYKAHLLQRRPVRGADTVLDTVTIAVADGN